MCRSSSPCFPLWLLLSPITYPIPPFCLLPLPSYYLVTHWVPWGLSAGILGDLLALTLYKSCAGNPLLSSERIGGVMSLRTALPSTAPQPLVLTYLFCDVSSFRYFILAMKSSSLEDLRWARRRESRAESMILSENNMASLMLLPFHVSVYSEWDKNKKSYQSQEAVFS